MISALLALATVTATPASPPACVIPDGTRIRLDLAIRDEERFLGLMFRDSLPADSGMLFIFPEEGRHPFWMKNTFIPLDLIWLDAAGAVVEVRANVEPCRSDPCPSYVPLKSGRAVLEVNAGFAKAHGLSPGVVLRWEGVPDYPVKGGAK